MKEMNIYYVEVYYYGKLEHTDVVCSSHELKAKGTVGNKLPWDKHREIIAHEVPKSIIFDYYKQHGKQKQISYKSPQYDDYDDYYDEYDDYLFDIY